MSVGLEGPSRKRTHTGTAVDYCGSVDEDAKSEVNAVAESSADDEAGSTRSGDARIGTWARLGRSVPVRDERLQDHALWVVE